VGKDVSKFQSATLAGRVALAIYNLK
jgi:hypothetical protein